MATEGIVPDVYCDQFTFALTPYGLAITFQRTPSSLNPVQPAMNEPQVVVRMSLEHAKTMVMLLRKNIRQYELEHLGDPIRIPDSLLNQMGLKGEDW